VITTNRIYPWSCVNKISRNNFFFYLLLFTKYKYPETVYQVMVATVKHSKWWLQLNL